MAVRFTVITHTLPVVARLIGLFLWMGLGRPDGWAEEPELRASDPRMFPIITCATVGLVLPLMEWCVYMEEGSGEDAMNPVALYGRWKARKRAKVSVEQAEGGT